MRSGQHGREALDNVGPTAGEVGGGGSQTDDMSSRACSPKTTSIGARPPVSAAGSVAVQVIELTTV